MKNFEKYKQEVYESIAVCNSGALLDHAGIKIDNLDYREIKKRLVVWLLQEYKGPILDDVEKAYLNSVIKPFRRKVNYITKIEVYDSNKCFIRITVNITEHVNLPYFNTESDMYRGLMSFRSYTPKELGL